MRKLALLGVFGASVAWGAVKQARNGEVDWEGQVVKATGSGAPDFHASNPAQARLGAEKAAQLDAFRNLLVQAKGIHIKADHTVGDEMAKDEVRGKVEGLIRGYRTTNKRYFSDSGVEMDVEVPLALLTEALVPPDVTSKPALNSKGVKKVTGLVVDARGLKFTRALAPRLLDEAGATLYSGQVLTDEARKSMGPASYAADLENAQKNLRVGNKPLVVKAIRAEGSDLIISSEDVHKIAAENDTYLSEGRVIIVANDSSKKEKQR